MKKQFKLSRGDVRGTFFPGSPPGQKKLRDRCLCVCFLRVCLRKSPKTFGLLFYASSFGVLFYVSSLRLQFYGSSFRLLFYDPSFVIESPPIVESNLELNPLL